MGFQGRIQDPSKRVQQVSEGMGFLLQRFLHVKNLRCQIFEHKKGSGPPSLDPSLHAIYSDIYDVIYIEFHDAQIVFIPHIV